MRPGSPQGLEPDSVSEERLARRWRRLPGASIAEAFERCPERCQRLALHGVPAELRWEVWQAAVGSRKHYQPGCYHTLLVQETSWSRLINADVPRTFPDLAAFDGTHLESLRRILTAYAVHNPALGYCQGMNFVVGLLLLVSKCAEEEVFWVLFSLMEDSHLGGFYGEGFPLLRTYTAAFSSLLQHAEPDLALHLEEESVQPGDYLQQWYLTLFSTSLPLTTVCVLWDGIFCCGLPLLLPLAVSALRAMRYGLLSKSFEDIYSFLRTLREGIGDDGAALQLGRLLLRKGHSLEVPLHVRRSLPFALPVEESQAVLAT